MKKFIFCLLILNIFIGLQSTESEKKYNQEATKELRALIENNKKEPVNIEKVAKLLEAGANVNDQSDEEKHTFLQIAFGEDVKNIDFYKLLLKQPDINLLLEDKHKRNIWKFLQSYFSDLLLYQTYVRRGYGNYIYEEKSGWDYYEKHKDFLPAINLVLDEYMKQKWIAEKKKSNDLVKAIKHLIETNSIEGANEILLENITKLDNTQKKTLLDFARKKEEAGAIAEPVRNSENWRALKDMLQQ